MGTTLALRALPSSSVGQAPREGRCLWSSLWQIQSLDSLLHVPHPLPPSILRRPLLLSSWEEVAALRPAERTAGWVGLGVGPAPCWVSSHRPASCLSRGPHALPTAPPTPAVHLPIVGLCICPCSGPRSLALRVAFVGEATRVIERALGVLQNVPEGDVFPARCK